MDLQTLVQRLNESPSDILGRQAGFDDVRDIVTSLDSELRSASMPAREIATSTLQRSAQQLLLNFAWASAVVAVRRKSAEIVNDGLLALAVEGGKLDIRDSTVAMALLFHSAQLLDVDVHRVFADSARLTPNPRFRDVMSSFPLRDPSTRELSAFLMREKMTPDGFTYEQTEP